MANIIDKTTAIRAAIYGEEVREALASGIEAINTEVVSTTGRQDNLEDTFEDLIINAGSSNAEIVAGRHDNITGENHATIGARLDGVSSSLEEKATQVDLNTTNDVVALKADTTYVDARVSTALSGTPKGTYTTLALLQSAHPTDDGNIYLVGISPSYIYDWIGTTWTNTNIIYASTGIANKSIKLATLANELTETKPFYNVYSKSANVENVVDFVFDITAIKGSLLTTDDVTVKYNFYTDDTNIIKIGGKLAFNNSAVGGVATGGDATSLINAQPYTNSAEYVDFSVVKGKFPTGANTYNYVHLLLVVDETDRTKFVNYVLSNVTLQIGNYILSSVKATALYNCVTGSTLAITDSYKKQLVSIEKFTAKNSLAFRTLSKEIYYESNFYNVRAKSAVTETCIDFVFDISAIKASLLTTDDVIIDYKFYSDEANILKIGGKIAFNNSGVGGDVYGGDVSSPLITPTPYINYSTDDILAFHLVKGKFPTGANTYNYVHLLLTVVATDMTIFENYALSNITLQIGSHVLTPTTSVAPFQATADSSISADINGNYQLVNYKNLKKFVIKTTSQSKWAGKIWNAIGDSQTAITTNATTNYHKYIADLIGCTVNNYGISGTGWRCPNSIGGTNAIYNRISGLVDADLITILAGTNDWTENYGTTMVLGTLGDTDPVATFYGAVTNTITQLISKYPTKTIAVFTPIKRANWDAKSGVTLENISDAIIKVCGKYSIPCLDLYRGCNMYPWNSDFCTALMPDATHPNNAGHKMLADKILAFLNTL